MANSERQREHVRRHYQRNKDYYKEKAKRAAEALDKEIREHKESRPCADCQQFFPYYVMQFDHRVGEIKVADVSTLQHQGARRRVLLEIAKCDVVCANCHATRTWTRQQMPP